MKITRSPKNDIVCEGSDVEINCGYRSNTILPVTWIINGTSYSEDEIMNSSSYKLNSLTTPLTYSLTVFSIKGTTTFQCMVNSVSNTPTVSATGKVFITGTVAIYVCYNT